MLLNNRKVTFIFRCPRTGFDVQGWSDGVFEASLAYETVNCTVCQMVQLAQNFLTALLAEPSTTVLGRTIRRR
jgi:hypothetical protein